jgi:isopentenyl diphosphate isomerase/L-lactate dehydrogenase-like FMN-dependent dehydrogenase
MGKFCGTGTQQAGQFSLFAQQSADLLFRITSCLKTELYVVHKSGGRRGLLLAVGTALGVVLF